MAELSPTFWFLIIFKDSLKLLSKNGKFMAPITLLSLLLPSLLLLLFCYVCQTLTDSIIKTLDSDSSSNLPIVAYLSLLLFEIICILAFAIISNISGIATILVSATSYTGTNISLQDLCSQTKTTFQRSKLFSYRSSSSKSGTIILATTLWTLVVLMVMFYPNAFAFVQGVAFGISVTGFLLYASVPTVLSSVVFVLEEKLEGWDQALEKAEQLIQGQRHHDLMIRILTNLLFTIIFLGFWLVSNVMGFWLFLVSFLCLLKIFGCVAYTVLYFRCKKYNGGDEEAGGVGNFGYSTLTASNLGDAISM